jgi:hypothetical protein
MQLTNALLISSLLFTLGGCCGGKSEPPSRWDTPGGGGKPATTATTKATATATATASATATAKATATATADAPKKVDAKPLDSKTANNLFPADGTNGFKRTYKADKAGYWEAEYKKDKDTLTLTISDSLVDKTLDFKKFASATDKVGGFPYTTTGKNKNQILVKDHVQLAASSQTLDEAARKAWLTKFDTGSVP